MELFPYFITRVSGLCIEHLDKLKANRTVNMLNYIQKNKELLLKNTDQLIKFLEKEIPVIKDKKIRHLYIQMKRDLFNMRQFKNSLDNTKKFLPQSIYEEMKMWEKKVEDIDRMDKNAKKVYQEELYNNRKEFQKLIKNEDFLNGILLSSQSLYNKVQKYIDTPIHEQKSRLCKVEYSLSKYFYRFITKTSPFSTFTKVGLGIWKDHLSEQAHIEATTFKSEIKVNHAYVWRAFEKLLHHSEIKKQLLYRINPSIRKIESKLTFTKKNDYPKKRHLVFKTLESTVSTDNSPVLKLVYDFFYRQKNHIVSYKSLLALLEDNFPGKSKDCKKFVDQLINKQLIEPVTTINEQTEDIISDVIEVLSEWNYIPIAVAVKKLFQKLAYALKNFQNASVTGRSYILKEIKSLLNEIYDKVGIEVSEKLLGTPLYEDAILTEKSFLSQFASKKALEDLNLFLQITPIFQFHIHAQMKILKHFKKKYGENGVCYDLVSFLNEIFPIIRDCYKEVLSLNLHSSKLENNDILIRLEELKKEFLESLENQSSNEEIIIKQDKLKSIITKIPKELRCRPYSHNIFAQIIKRDKGIQLVINEITKGEFTFYSRFFQYFLKSSVLPLARDYLKRVYGSKGELAEISGVYGFNGNLHPALTQFELEVPNNYLTRTDHTYQKVLWDDLELRIDNKTRSLFLNHKTLGRMKALFTGSLTPLQLPNLVSSLMFIQNNTSVVNKHTILEIIKKIKGEEDRIEFIPRIRIGDVILSRKKWRISKKFIDDLINKNSDYIFFRKLHEWRNCIGLPTQVFISLVPNNSNILDVDNNASFVDIKPQFIDFENPILVRLFRKVITDHSNGLIIEEMLPKSNNISLKCQGNFYVSELILEMSNGICQED